MQTVKLCVELSFPRGAVAGLSSPSVGEPFSPASACLHPAIKVFVLPETSRSVQRKCKTPSFLGRGLF